VQWNKENIDFSAPLYANLLVRMRNDSLHKYHLAEVFKSIGMLSRSVD